MAKVDDVRSRVQRFLQDSLSVVELRGERFVIPYGSTSCVVAVRADTQDPDGPVLVVVAALVLGEVTATADLYEYVGRSAGSYRFGHLYVLEHPADPRKGQLIFGLNLLGDTIDEGELMHAVAAVVSVADRLDDELAAKFGGKTLREVT